MESYNGNITAPWGNISGQSISSTSTITGTGHISGGTMTTNTLTTSSSVMNIKSDLVLFKGKDNTIYLDTHLGGTSFLTDTYTDGMIKNKGGISVGDQTAVNTWTSTCSIYSGTGI